MAEAYLEHPDKTRTRLDRPVSLGRSSSCDIIVNETECSRRHALFNPQVGGEVWVVDLGSTNGTLHNGKRLSRPTRLADGDRLTIGRSEFMFRSSAPAPQDPTGGATQLLTQPMIRVERAWLLLADIEGFTPFSQQHPPAEVARRVGGWIAACSARFTDANAEIQVFLGDGFLSFLPVKPDPTPRFLRIVESLRALQQDPAHLPFRLVIHQAEISLGRALVAAGPESVLGPGVNFLFRMEKAAGAARVRCALTQDALDAWPSPKPAVRALPPQSLKGFPGEHPLYALT